MRSLIGFIGTGLSLLWSPTVRWRSFRLTLLIILVLGLALAALSFKNINIDLPGGLDLRRDGAGPLGLKLGLDLRGGGSLIYQADTGTRIDVTFEEPTSPVVVAEALQELRYGEEELAFENYTIEFRDPLRVRIKAPLLDDNDPRLTNFEETTATKLETIASVQVNSVQEPTEEQMDGVLDIINRRVNLFGTEEPIIQRFGDNRVIIQLPGASGSVTLLRFLEPDPEIVTVDAVRAGLIRAGYEDVTVEREADGTFRVQSATVSRESRDSAPAILTETLGVIDQFQVASAIDNAKNLIGQTAQLVFTDRTCGLVNPINSGCLDPTDADIGLTGDDLSRAFVTTDPSTGAWAVSVGFDGRGSDIFSDLTRRIVGQENRRIGIFLDDDLVIDVVARAWIRNGQSQITGQFSREEARTLAIQLESGRLPVPLKLIQENDVDALLGSESLRNSLIAGLVGLGLVMGFMVCYYRMAGVVASLALVFYTIVMLSTFKLIPITLTLSHIGGFILSIGMAVDANVLIFERMKEELRVGRTLASSMEVGFSRAWPAIRDGNFSTLITCGVLLWFGDRLGGGLVTGFAISLGIGVLASMFTAVIVSRNLLQLMAWVGLAHRVSLFTPEGSQRTGSTARESG